MPRVLPTLLLLSLGASASASEPQERNVESILPALAYGPACWSTLDLQNLGDRPVIVEVEAHRASGALVPLVGHRQVIFHMNAGERASYRLEIPEETGDAWVRVREKVPSPRIWPVVAVAGTTECVANNQLRTTARQVAYPTRNPWFSGDVSEMPGNVIALVNTSERPAKISLCYSAGNLYSVPGQGQTIPQLTPVCSHFFEIQIPPFGACQFPVERDGNSHFSLKTEGDAIALEMLRPVATGVKIYTVNSTIRFQQ
jgi:hypothetical protein